MRVLHCCIATLILSLVLATQSAAVHQRGGPDASANHHQIFPGPLPHFRVVPCDQTATDGDEYVQFHCVPAGAPGLKIEWEIISPDGEHVVGDKHQVSEDGTRLRILQPMNFYDNCKVHCNLFSPYNHDPLTATAKLFVREPHSPDIVVKPRSGKYKHGSRIVLECAAQGWPLPTISWVFVSRQQKLKRFFNADGVYRDFVKETNRLIILKMNPHTAGTYVCIASNSHGHARVAAYVGFDRRSVRRQNLHFIMETLRGVYKHNVNFANDAQRKMGRKATCKLEVMNQFSWLPPDTRHRDRSTLTYDYLVDMLNKNRLKDTKSLPGEAINIDLSLLQFIKANLNCSSTAVPVPDCRSHYKFLKRYASADGSCNNFKRPWWGQAGRKLKRWLRSQYELGLNLPQGYQKHRLYYGFLKPSTRTVSVRLMLNKQLPVDGHISQMFSIYGQLLDHDLDLVPGAATDRGILYSMDCNEHCRVDLPCFPIPAPRDDPRVKGCLTFKRSAAFCSSDDFNGNNKCIHPREQINQITSVIDANMVYGSSCGVMNQLREPNSYLLKTSDPATGQRFRLLPISLQGVPTACGRNRESPNTPCFSAGDVRVNGFTLLTTQHTMLVREHNRIGSILQKYNPHWCADKVFYETRRIVAALIQQITYNEYLPVLLGLTGMQELVQPYKGYRPDVNPNLANAFTIAFRIGHTMISEAYGMLNEKYQPIMILRLERLLFAPHWIFKNGIDSLVRSALTFSMKNRKKGAGSYTESAIQRLFELTSKVAGDLAALDIQRGRDHGIPSYNHWRSFCGLKWAVKWEDLEDEIRDKRALKALRKVYGSPGNIDLFTGIVMENPIDDSVVGPTGRCIMAKQFKNVRDGDRHWFENPGEFTPAQVKAIRRYTYSRLVCNTVETIHHVQKKVFFVPRTRSDLMPCTAIPNLDLKLWKDYDNQRRKCIPSNPCADDKAGGSEGGQPGGARHRRQ